MQLRTSADPNLSSEFYPNLKCTEFGRTGFGSMSNTTPCNTTTTPDRYFSGSDQMQRETVVAVAANKKIMKIIQKLSTKD